MKTSLLLSIALIGLTSGCDKIANGRLGGSDATALPSVEVRAATVVTEMTRTTIEVSGTLQAVERAQLAAKISGPIEEMPVTLGQHVRAGEVLVKIADADIAARVAQARAQLEAAKKDLERERGLFAQGASAKESVRSFEDRVTAADAQLREAEALLQYTRVRAPFDGLVARKPANTGDLATPGALLLELHGEGAYEIEAAVPESAAGPLRLGVPVTATIAATQVTFTGHVAEISSAADPRTRAVLIKVSVPCEVKVHGGQFVRLAIPGELRPSMWVPLPAVQAVGQIERSFTVSRDGSATLRLVRTGPTLDGRVEILAGLIEGDRVILSPSAGLRDGDFVEVLQ